MGLLEEFTSCSLTPLVVSSTTISSSKTNSKQQQQKNTTGTSKERSIASSSSRSGVTIAPDGGSWKTRAFYLDSSGRSSIHLPLRLQCPSKEFLDLLIRSKCFDAYSITTTTASEEEVKDEGRNNINANATFGIEAKVVLTFGSGVAISAEVEDVAIQSATIVDDEGLAAVDFDVVIMVRVSRADGEKFVASSSSQVKTNLEICGVLVEKLVDIHIANDTSLASIGLDALSLQQGTTTTALTSSGSMNGNGYDSSSSSQIPRLNHIRAPPVSLLVVLTHALVVSVSSIAGPAASTVVGQTLVSLTIRHSDTHSEPVVVTDITFHPGYSIEQQQPQQQQQQALVVADPSTTPTIPNSDMVISDMSRAVTWLYAPQCDPGLPIVLRPHEAVCTILEITAHDDFRTRTFTSPLSVTAFVGAGEDALAVSSSSANANDVAPQQQKHQRRFPIVAASEVQWTSSRAPLEPTDAFRIDMSITSNNEREEDSSTNNIRVLVGSTFFVHLDITNLSPESRDLMVLVENTAGTGSKPLASAVVSEKDGQKFGVWGLTTTSEDDDYSSGGGGGEEPPPPPTAAAGGGGVTSTEAELLTVDVALLLGECKGSSTKKSKLRFIPLKEGTLSIPNLKLIDRRRSKWYHAPHNLQVVVHPR